MGVYVHDHQSCSPDSLLQVSSGQLPLQLLNYSPAGEEALRPLGSSPFSLQDQRHSRPTIVLRSFKNISLLQPYD